MKKIFILVSVLFTIVAHSQNAKYNKTTTKTTTSKQLNREQIMKKMHELDSVQKVLDNKKQEYISDEYLYGKDLVQKTYYFESRLKDSSATYKKHVIDVYIKNDVEVENIYVQKEKVAKEYDKYSDMLQKLPKDGWQTIWVNGRKKNVYYENGKIVTPPSN